MTNTTWDPQQYAAYRDHRARPFHDLLANVDAPSPHLVVDLGCGDGPLTLGLAARWPDARIVGIDSSPEMLDAARALDTNGRVEWVNADLETWQPRSLSGAPDVILTNATLQWVPTHLNLLPRWVESLTPGGWFGLQVPGNFDAPSHQLMRDCAEQHPRGEQLLKALSLPHVAEPGTYLHLLDGLGLDTQAWETTYLHPLDPAAERENPVLDWVEGTGLRRVLGILTEPAERAAFLKPYGEALKAAYPRTRLGVVLPFRRIFAVGRKR